MSNSSFKDRVLKVVSEIPKGETLTYKEVAILAGHPGAYRAVGSLMKRNFDASIPCHRVVRSDKTVGQYNRGGPLRKQQLLDQEKN